MVEEARLSQYAKLMGIGFAAVVITIAIGNSSTLELVALTVFGVVSLVTLRYPLVALSMLIIMIVSNLSPNLIVGFGAPSIAKLAVPGLTALLIMRYFLWGDRPYIGWLSLWLMVGYLALTLFGATYAVDWRVTLDSTVDFIKVVMVALLVLAFMRYRNGFETVVVSSVATVTAICSLGFIQVLGVVLPPGIELFSHFDQFHGRFEGPIDDGNFFAVILVFHIPLALGFFFRSDSFLKSVFWGLAAALLLLGLLLTQSRGGILALFVGLGILFFQLTSRQKLFGIIAFASLLAAAFAFLGEEAFERLSTLGNLAETVAVDKGAEGRLAAYKVAWELFATHPWEGVGTGNFKIHYQDVALEKGLIFRGEGRSAHSLYLEVLAEKGLVGLLYFLAILLMAAFGLVGAFQAARAHGDDQRAGQFIAFGAGLAGYLAGMVLLHDSYPRFLWIVILLAVEAGRIARLKYMADGDMPDHLNLLRLPRDWRAGSGRNSLG